MYKILIADTPETQVPQHDYEMKIFREGLGDEVVIEVHDYNESNREAFLEALEDVDAVLTAYLIMDKEAIERAPKLKIISINATGYNNVDLKAASERNVGVSPIGEYCTKDVAEFTIGLIHMLVKNMKTNINNVEQRYKWEYNAALPNRRIEDLTLGIVGIGKIGKETAKKALALGMDVIATDPNVDEAALARVGLSDVKLVSKAEIPQKADIISNHMNLNDTNHDYFDYEYFKQTSNKPYFINTGRADCLVETDLVKALDEGILNGAALDVIRNETEGVDLKNHPLVNREDAIVTAHTAFYSTSSMEDLQRISCQNIVHFLNGEREKVFKLVNSDQIK